MTEPQGASQKPDISLFFPVFNDERTIRTVTEKAVAMCEEHANHYEVLIIDDGSVDRSAEIGRQLADEYPHVRIISHGTNRGYGAAIRTGLDEAVYEWICFTDGDDEYDIFDFPKMLRLRDYYDLIITFRYVRLYSGFRIFVSRVYNALVRVMFRTSYRDISTGLRMVRRSVVREVSIESTSPFIGAEITIKLMLMGFRIGEMGIQTFPRVFGRGASVTLPNIIATIRDLLKVHHTIFSKHYNLPPGRSR